MFLATAVVLTAVTTATPPARLASTYDQAACADDEGAAPDALLINGERIEALINNDASPADAEAINCSEPPAAPAVIDCNDERASRFVAEMIGSCDMPKPPAPTGGPAVVHAPAGAPVRICDGIHCSHDSSPIRAAARAPDDGSPLQASAFSLAIVFAASPLDARAQLKLQSIDGPRVERPPRAV
ncbi:MAG TPA: hypothetical protein VFF06_09610 [Polyangia bacterium]|nr:hypothetical protein [Polyangia bacterium]